MDQSTWKVLVIHKTLLVLYVTYSPFKAIVLISGGANDRRLRSKQLWWSGSWP